MQYVRAFFNILFYIDIGIIFLHFLIILIEFIGYFFDEDFKLKNLQENRAESLHALACGDECDILTPDLKNMF